MSIEVRNVSKNFNAFKALNSINLDIHSGELVALLGPSGCGKTTLLNLIAGFADADEGEIFIDDTPVTALPPYQRQIGIVFQNYALFPHMTVERNIAYGLRMRRVPAAEIERRVREAMALVKLDGLGERKPRELSGGQQQRVALARALAPKPRLLLMDEPFSSLDTTMRESIAREVRAILKHAKATALMVTHDQNEAFAMADNVGVMSHGQLMQWGNAVQVYCAPATQEVARFVGEGALVPAQSTPGGQWQTALGMLPAGHPHFQTEQGVQVLLRPEHVRLVEQGVSAQVRERTFRGSHFVFELELPDGQSIMAKASLNALYGSCDTVRIGLAADL